MMNKLIFGRYMPGDSLIHRLDPRAKLLASFYFIGIIFLANNWETYLVLAVFTLFSVFLSKVDLKFFIRGIQMCIRDRLQGSKLVLNVGYSHPVEITPPAGVTVEVPANTQVIVKGANKEEVGELAANIRGTRPPEPYKGKGIRYVGEYVRRKEGKTGK